MENTIINMQPMSHVNFNFKWNPDKIGNYNFFISFEVKQREVKLKYLVSVTGVCIKQAPKANRFENILQPVKRDFPDNFNDKYFHENYYAIVIQKNIRMYLQKNKYLKIKKSVVKIQRWFRANLIRIKHLKIQRAIKKQILACFSNDFNDDRKTW